MLPALRHTLTSLAAWTVGAVVAVGVGILALSAIGDGWASGAPQPLRPDSAAPAGASKGGDLTPNVVPRPSTEAGTPSPTAGPPRTLSSRGGTVSARCTGTDAYLISWSPAQGYRVDEFRRGPATRVFVKFKAPRSEPVLVVHCVQGIPQPDTNWREDELGD